MDKQQLIKLTALRLGNVRGLDTMIDAEIDATVVRLENEPFHPWFLLSENNIYRTSAGENRVPVPDEFLAEYDDGAMYIKLENGFWKPLPKMSQEEMMLEFQGEASMPRGYSLTNKYFRLFPTPDKEYELELLFYRRSVSIAGTNAWYKEASDLVVYETASHILLARKDKRAQVMQGLADGQKQALMARHTEREESNRDGFLGGYD